jgi:hypothetical protein
MTFTLSAKEGRVWDLSKQLENTDKKERHTCVFFAGLAIEKRDMNG